MTEARLVRLIAPLVWRSSSAMARKLAEFAVTEAGSALDMLRAAELAHDPRLRRVFLRHALDEAKHARLFRRAADQIDSTARHRLSALAQKHGRRQDLYEKLGLVGLLAFVHRAERRGEAHFRSVIRELESTEPQLARLFQNVASDERFHVRYSQSWLRRLAGPQHRAALRKETAKAAWAAWRRAGRALGERGSWMVGLGLYFVVLPAFAVVQRRLDPERTGWKPSRALPSSIDEARRQF